MIEKLTLSFCSSSAGNIELARTEIRLRDGSCISAVRRAAPSIRDGFGSFIWSSGVRGFSLLCVGTAAARQAGDTSPYTIAGAERSLATALDRALNKPADWISEIFGSLAVRSMFRRENSERKRAGPVRISFAPGLQSGSVVAVFLNGRPCSDLESLRPLADSLGEGPYPLEGAANSDFLSEIEQESFQQLLRSAGPLTRSRPGQKALQRVSSSEIDPIRILSVPSASGANATLQFTANLLNLAVDWHFEKATSELISLAQREVKSGRRVWVVLSRDAAAKLARSRASTFFRRCFLLPQSSLELLVPPGVAKISEILVSGAGGGYPRRYLRFLRAIAHPRIEKRLLIITTPLDRMVSALRKRPGAGLIVAAPYSLLICRALGLSLLDTKIPTPQFAEADNILFVSRSDPQTDLPIQLRRSWLNLLESKSEHAAVVQAVYSSLSFTSLQSEFLRPIET